MANAKYEFTGQTKNWLGKTLHQIRAVAAFGFVVKGEIGGWIEAEVNLSVTGDAWVTGNARVTGNAWVTGNARVEGNARVTGNAWVAGDARVEGDADFFLLGPIGSRHDYLTIHADAMTGIRVATGCFSGSADEFLAAVAETHGTNAHGAAYRKAVELALLMVKPAQTEQQKAA